LERALRDAQSGRPKVVLITAEPGAGKSRLCHEFVERSRGVALYRARALSHGRMLPFHAIVELGRALFGVDEGASAADVRGAVGRGLASAPPVDPIALAFWLGSAPALASLAARIEARAGGNPLFVEEIIRSLVERGLLRGERGACTPAAPVEEIALPETVQAVLASRIDRLSPSDKDVLQAAAVVGRDVPTELLRLVVDLPAPELAAALERLTTAELLGPAAHPGERAFRHP